MTDHVPAGPALSAPPPTCPADPGAVALGGLGFQQAPARLYQELRLAHGPVAPVLLDGGVPAWLVLGYRELHYVTSHDELFARDSRRWNQWENIPADWPLLPFVGYQPSVLFTEGAEHRRRSGVISDALAEVDQFELKRQCEEVADRLINAFAGRGRADLMAAYAHRLPLLAAIWMCGLPESQTADMVRDLIASLDAAEGDDPVAAYLRVQQRVQALLEQKRAVPGPDVTSRMLAHPARLADPEIVQDLITVIAAAQQPTANWIGNALRLMLTDDRFAVTLSGGRGSVGQALNEVLWEDTPTQNFVGRWATRDTRLGGRQIRQGDCVLLGLAAANTDPEVRPDGPAGVGGNSAHVSFSHGEHRCPYPAPELAEAIAGTAVEVLLDRLPDVELSVPPRELVWRPSIWMRGLEALPVHFTSAHAG
ncbi:putative cytochrome P450 [Actinacidiphila reveromycinica]|uniref:Putative cytochrome P450 n=1 Tax=Actinacidiphila reveromycinica TaxID=659352 RepID=A0A7U3UR12_9ACTN|nr:cytochrome P450 [Streptomyces sp. SN-593]BBA97148.1 putative cytochrome P450 [Streptomyces sp. SN-593]